MNCKGLNNQINPSKVIHYLRHLDAHIIDLQKTHLGKVDGPRLKSNWIGQVYHAPYSSKAREVAILLHKAVLFVHIQMISDHTGQFIFVIWYIYDMKVTLANVHAPNWDDDTFFRQIFSMLPDLSSCILILGGDFNCWMDPSLDRSSSTQALCSKSARMIDAFMKEFNLTDP